MKDEARGPWTGWSEVRNWVCGLQGGALETITNERYQYVVIIMSYEKIRDKQLDSMLNIYHLKSEKVKI